MALADARIKKAIQRMAKEDPEIRSLLTLVRNRGGIDGLYMQIGGASDEEYKDGCCSNGLNGTEEPTEKECQSIEGDAPTDMGGGLCAEEEWTDCATGAAINFSPDGFSRIETCKQSVPNPDWYQGYFWKYEGSNGATPEEAMNKAISAFLAGAPSYCAGRYEEVSRETNESGETVTIIMDLFVQDCSTGNWTQVHNDIPCYRVDCLSSTASYCTITEAPEVIGDDWGVDNTTEFTLRGGCFFASNCDPDASATAKSCNECITICNNSGEQRTMCATADGGYILYDPTGINSGGKYDENGIRTELLPAGSTGGYINGA